MSVAGTWKLVMQTPIGERKASLALTEQGSSLTGTMTGEEGNSTAITDGKVSGGDISFKAAIKSPMPLTLEVTAKAAGNAISGTVNASGVGSWPFTGTKA